MRAHGKTSCEMNQCYYSEREGLILAQLRHILVQKRQEGENMIQNRKYLYTDVNGMEVRDDVAPLFDLVANDGDVH